MDHLQKQKGTFYTTSSFVHHFKSICKFKLNCSLETLNLGQNCRFLVLRDLEIWWMILENNITPLLLYYVKLCASFQIHRWIQTGVTVRKLSIWVKIGDLFVPCDLEIRQMITKNNRAPLLCCFKHWASFQSHHEIQTWVTVRKLPIQIKIGNFFPLSPWNLMDDHEKL